VRACPFCGCDRCEMGETTCLPWETWHHVQCGYCGARGPRTKARESAVRLWNMRIDPAHTVSEGTEVRDA